MVVLFQTTAKKQICLITFLIRYAHLQKTIVYYLPFYIKPTLVKNMDVLSIMKLLDSSKSHRCDNISIKMITICSESVNIPLEIIFEESLRKRSISINMEKNVVPIHKKEDKSLIKNYRPISLLPI